MTNVLIYWRDYRKNAEGQVTAWHSNAKLLGELLPGDRLWFVTSVAAAGIPAAATEWNAPIVPLLSVTRPHTALSYDVVDEAFDRAVRRRLGVRLPRPR